MCTVAGESTVVWGLVLGSYKDVSSISMSPVLGETIGAVIGPGPGHGMAWHGLAVPVLQKRDNETVPSIHAPCRLNSTTVS